MNNKFSDSTVILAIFATIIFVFTLIFLVSPSQDELQPSIQWKESPTSSNKMIKI